MNVKRSFYLNNKRIQPPKNAQGITIELNYDKDNTRARGNVNFRSIELVKDAQQIVKDWIAQGRIFEGVPFRYELERGSDIEQLFDGYVDLTQDANFNCDIVTADIKKKKDIDWLNDVADSVSFEYLYSIGKITMDDIVAVPYVISTIPNYREAFLTILSVTAISIQIYDSIQGLVELAAEVSNPFELTAIIRAALRIAYLIILIATLIQLISDLFNYLIQPVKYHSSITLKRLFEVGCEFLGYNFKSNFFDNEDWSNVVLLPEKLNVPTNQEFRILGFLNPEFEQPAYTRDTFGQFLRKMKKIFRAKIVIDGNYLFFISEADSIAPPKYTLPALYQPNYSTNAADLKSNYLIEFRTDLNDKNTYQQYQGTLFQVTTTQEGVIDRDYNLIKNLETIQIDYALGKRKQSLTDIEELMRDFLDIAAVILNNLIKAVNTLIRGVNAIIDLINDVLDALDFIGISLGFDIPSIPTISTVNLGNSIENRVGMLLLENDFVSVPKLLKISKGSQSKFNKLSIDNSEFINAKTLWDKYHKQVQSFVPSPENPNGSQFIIKEFEKVPFCYDDYLAIRKNNAIFMSNGDKAFIDSCQWNEYDNIAKIKVRINKLYTNKLKETYIYPNGQ